MTQTNSTLNGVTLQPEEDLTRIVEAKIVQRYRHMEATAGRHGRPFMLVIHVHGRDVSFYDGQPAGRMVQDE